NQDGPAIQPGSRSYDRSWIRDGSLTSDALLRLGFAEYVKPFVEWYAPFQFPNGKVPCCVDARGADPVPENDSHGQLIFLIAEYYRSTRDRALVERLWPHVEKAVAYMQSLTAERKTPAYQTPEKRAYYGLVPESISHEGYSAKPMHSYWDDLFVLKGLQDAAFLAGILGRDTNYAQLAAEFRKDLHASIEATRAMHKIDYIPGSVELGDFDATSTTIYLSPGEEQAHLDQAALHATFDRYYRESMQRIATNHWEAYTPYEWRTVGSFLRLGQPDRARDLIRFFLGHMRPAGWNQWAEVVWRDERAPKFIGDMPHTWVGSDFIRSILDLVKTPAAP
ncbi:MAG: discoidin domain-containing protein, partial [Thermoanaerobaculia bacterium]